MSSMVCCETYALLYVEAGWFRRSSKGMKGQWVLRKGIVLVRILEMCLFEYGALIF